MLYINGEPDDTGTPVTILALLQSRNLRPERVAVECNGVIIRRAAFSNTLVNDGDRIEIVHFVGGG
ncbi:MAG: sulfur carrier protein ThiS [Hominisplanchenecus sp.]|nr:sulfur carrier protein ThiS [Hominisplanchenecus sp.]